MRPVTDLSSIVTPAAYLLFYRKRKTNETENAGQAQEEATTKSESE